MAGFEPHATIERVFRFLPSLVLSVVVGLAAPVESAQKAAIQAALDMAHGAPGEFAADALLRIAALDAVDTPQRVKLIEEAFQRADEAQQPYKRRNAMPNIPSNVQFQQRAFAQDLDALSLRMRAIETMLPLDSAKARQLFFGTPPLDLPPVPCEDVMVFDVSSYYQALTGVALRGFTPKEMRNGDAAQFVSQHVARIFSPAEIAPAVRAMTSAGLDDLQFAGALAAFNDALKRISKDDRSFTFYLADAGGAVQTLIADITRRRLSPLPLIEAYRLYLVSNFAAPRCADDAAMTGSAAPGARPALDSLSLDAIRSFNESMRAGPLQPIETTEAAATSTSGVAAGLSSCVSQACAAIARQYRALIFSPEGSAVPNAVRETAEWRRRFEEVLAALRDWPDSAPDAATDDAAQQFREKCAFYTELAALPSDARMRQSVLIALLDYLQRSRDRARTRIEWLLPVNLLIGRMRLDPAGLGGLEDAFHRTTDPVIAMYAKLEAAAPRSPSEVLALM
jgi:hypothetical protein